MEESRKRQAGCHDGDEGPRKAQRTNSETFSDPVTHITQEVTPAEASIYQVLQEMQGRFNAWDTALSQALNHEPSGFSIENKAILNNLREDFMVSGFSVFKKRVTNIVGHNQAETQIVSPAGDPTEVTTILRNLQAVQEFLLANNGTTMAPPMQTAGPSTQRIPGLMPIPSTASSGFGGSQKPLKQESPSGCGSSSHTVEEDANAFLQEMEDRLSSNRGLANPVPPPTPYLPLGQQYQYPQHGLWIQNVPQHMVPHNPFPLAPPASAPRHLFHASAPEAVSTPVTAPKKPSPLFALVCPFDLLGKPCPREDRGHRKYPCDAKKVCKRHPGCHSQYCGDVHILRTCKSFVHNGKCENGGRNCKLGHSHVWERRQVADRARSHEYGVPFIPSSGQMRGNLGNDLMGGGDGGGSSVPLRSSRYPNDGRLKGT